VNPNAHVSGWPVGTLTFVLRLLLTRWLSGGWMAEATDSPLIAVVAETENEAVELFRTERMGSRY
jgi:hypothetical protein